MKCLKAAIEEKGKYRPGVAQELQHCKAIWRTQCTWRIVEWPGCVTCVKVVGWGWGEKRKWGIVSSSTLLSEINWEMVQGIISNFIPIIFIK